MAINKIGERGIDTDVLQDINAIASETELGRIKVGQNLEIESDGTLNALGGTVPDASLTDKGIVQLSSATDSDSEVLAATPKAVKAVLTAAAKEAEKGKVNGLATLGSDGKLTPAQRPDAALPSNYQNDSITIYVSNTGNDNTDGRSPGTAVRTIAKAIELIKPLGAKKRTIQLTGGHTFNEEVRLEGMTGSLIEINGTYSNNATVRGFTFDTCSAIIKVLHVDVRVKGNVTAVEYYGAHISECTYVSIYMGTWTGLNFGVYVRKSRALVDSLAISNTQGSIIEANDASFVYVNNNSGANPSQFATTYNAYSGIIIGNVGTLTGTGGQKKSSGGQIFFT